MHLYTDLSIKREKSTHMQQYITYALMHLCTGSKPLQHGRLHAYNGVLIQGDAAALCFLGPKSARDGAPNEYRLCFACVCVCMYVCMYVSYVCMYVCMYLCMHACMYVSLCAWEHTFACLYVSLQACIRTFACLSTDNMLSYAHTFMRTCMPVWSNDMHAYVHGFIRTSSSYKHKSYV